MSLQTCVAEAKDWAKQNSELKLRSDEIEHLGRIISAAHDAGATMAEKMKLMNDAVTRRIELDQLAVRGEKALNAIKNVQNTANIAKNIELWGDKPDGPANAIEALITGKSARPGFGVNNDPVVASRANMTRYMGFMENALSKSENKIFKALDRGDDLSGKITQELYALREDPKMQSGQSGSDIALSIAKKMREAQDAVFKEAQAANPYLRENQLYAFSRSHNRELITKTPEATWIGDAKAAFGKNMIGDDTQITSMLRETYKSITSGLPPEGTPSSARFWEPQGTGGSQAAKSAGQRVFVANDWKAEFDYNAKYGDSPYNAYVKQAQRQADYVATVNKWGTRSADNYAKLFSTVENSIEDPKQAQMLQNRKNDLGNKFQATQASQSNEVWNMQGRIAQGLVAAENMSMLGNHVPRTFTSGPAIMAQIRDGYGMNVFQNATSMAQSFAKLMANFGDAGVKEMQHWGISSMSVNKDLTNSVIAGSGQQLGAAAKLSRLLSKVTLADYTTNAWKFIMAENDTRILGGHANTPFEQLRPQMQELLQRHGLGDDRWEVMRQGLDDKGRMTTDSPRNLTDEQLRPLLGDKASPASAQQMRGELAQNLGTLLNRRASMAVGESNAASRAEAYGLSDMNSPQGIARNWFYQFKQASLVRQQLLQQTFRSGGDNTSNMSGTIQYMLGSAFAGMVGQQVIELGARREPLDITSPKILGHMLSSTGIAGFYGEMLADYLTAPEPDMAKKLVEGDFLGPSFGTVIKGGEAAFRTGRGLIQYAEGKTRENQFGGKQWADLLQSLTPGQNIFYAKGALDYTLFNGVREFMGDSGHLGVLRQQMHQNKNLFGGQQQNSW